jgi:flavin reductase (DIM6/NTAB) family NADH-FMN oxidoreductase RutF
MVVVEFVLPINLQLRIMNKDSTGPNPNWIPGQKIVSPVDKMVTCDISKITAQEAYKLLIGTVVPRPIAFVSTISSDGKGNLAPFSFFNGVSSKPLCIMISITRRSDGSKKDSLLNIEATGEFVVNTVAEWMIEPVNHCAAEYPYGVNEMDMVGLTPLKSEKIKPNRVKESPIQLECKVHKLIEIGDGAGGSTVVIGEVLLAHVHDKAYENGRILLNEILPISRLAGDFYGLTPETFALKRPRL